MRLTNKAQSGISKLVLFLMLTMWPLYAMAEPKDGMIFELLKTLFIFPILGFLILILIWWRNSIFLFFWKVVIIILNLIPVVLSLLLMYEVMWTLREVHPLGELDSVDKLLISILLTSVAVIILTIFLKNRPTKNSFNNSN